MILALSVSIFFHLIINFISSAVSKREQHLIIPYLHFKLALVYNLRSDKNLNHFLSQGPPSLPTGDTRNFLFLELI